MNGLATSWKQDNNMIYFAAVPDPTSLPPLPTGTNMVRTYVGAPLPTFPSWRRILTPHNRLNNDR